MCILAQPVRTVSNTRIFVGSNGTRQLTVYEMYVKLADIHTRTAAKMFNKPIEEVTKAERDAAKTANFGALYSGGPVEAGNAMILPAPAASPSDIELIDMSEHPKFFDDLDLAFRRRSRSLSKSAPAGGHLEVHKVGNYDVSIADTLDDLDRLNPEVFTLSDDAKQALGPNYSRLNGPKHVFIVAVLRESGKFHPLAYTHPIAADGKLFVPTRHEHGHNHSEDPHGGRADWDHHIFHTQTGSDFAELPGTKNHREVRSVSNEFSSAKRLLDKASEKVPAIAPYMGSGNLVRSKFKGPLRNMDLRL